MEVTFMNTFLPWIAAVCAWTTLYNILCLLNPKRSYEWHCRAVTCIHACITISLTSWCSFVQGPWVLDEAGGPSTPLQHYCVINSWGYFFYDVIWCLYHQTESPFMLLHHFLSNIGLSITASTGFYGTEMTATLLGTEFTNPLLQLRWFLRETGQYNTWLADINEFLFMFLFGALRLGIGTLLLYTYYQFDTDFLGRLGGTCIYAISWVFFIMIVKFAIKKYTKRYKEWRKGAKQNEINGNKVPAHGDGPTEEKKEK